MDLTQTTDWLSMAIRWFHLMAGITWIGNSFFFMWLDAHLRPPEPAKDRVDGSLWMVHSGGFYLVEKSRIAPGRVPNPLYWFKWETTATLITGLGLLAVVYYTHGGMYLLKGDGSGLPWSQAVACAVGILVSTWLLYDFLWSRPLILRQPKLGHACTVAILVAMILLYCQILGCRAAFLHIGATMGTVMTANVWRRILPGQKLMIEAAQRGEEPDFSHGYRAKHRSIHNSYMTLPVVFFMISNHYPILYAHSWNWLVALLIVLTGAAARHFMLERHHGKPSIKALAIAILSAIMTLWICHGAASGAWNATSTDSAPTLDHGNALNSPSPSMPHSRTHDAQSAANGDAAHDRALEIVRQRCLPCHAQHPQMPGMSAPPQGVVFEQATQVLAFARIIQERVVRMKNMPPANLTGMTEAERSELGQWLESQTMKRSD